jgi:hypothetical protein
MLKQDSAPWNLIVSPYYRFRRLQIRMARLLLVTASHSEVYNREQFMVLRKTGSMMDQCD